MATARDTMLSNTSGLTEAELDRLTEFLSNSKNGAGMTIEELDGFFTALVAGPELVPPSEYLPQVLGSDLPEAREFSGLDEANEILGLILRHWNGIAATLHRGDPHLPVLLEDAHGVCQASEWSHGFVRGMNMRPTRWAELVADEEHGGSMIPVLTLYHEHDEDPELRPEPISKEKREEIILHMLAGVVKAYRYFRTHARQAPAGAARKVGRNETCPCGSGKKHKRCCGG